MASRASSISMARTRYGFTTEPKIIKLLTTY